MARHVNANLRSHVTRVGFNLQLGTLQIYYLVRLDENKVHKRERGRFKWYSEQTVRGMQGLGAKGLVKFLNPGWEITPAGEAVVLLLHESGLYEEYSSASARKDRAS